ALYVLANALDSLLKDKGDPEKADRPNLVEFWNASDYQKLKGRIARFRDAVQLGDPLVVTRSYGKGRVVAFLTSLGRSWTDWAGGSSASFTFPVVMLELQKYLTSGGPANSLIVGTPLEMQLDTSRYDTKMRRYFLPETADNLAPGGEPSKQVGRVDL